VTGISRAVMDRLSRVDGTRAAMIVEAEAGVPVAAELADGVNGTAMAALAASLFRRCVAATGSGGFGSPSTLQLEAEDGHLVVVGGSELLVVVLTTREAQLGMIRLEAQRVAEQLA
jgi:predicted regulator of Ras-like GTPase activity (Roadblock/LC7/MglB family)